MGLFQVFGSFRSIVLMALVDADYKFIYVDIGCQGRLSDGAVMRNCSFTELLNNKKLDLPDDAPLPDLDCGSVNDSFLDGQRPNTPLPFVIVADDAFALSRHCMKPYAQKALSEGKRIFNYRLSRARRTSENAFGILVNVFRIFHAKINLSTEVASKLTLACCILHNLLRTLSTASYKPTVNAGEWRNESLSEFVTDLPPTNARRARSSVESVRDSFKHYFQHEEQFPGSTTMYIHLNFIAYSLVL